MSNTIRISVSIDSDELAKALEAKKLKVRGVRLTLLTEFLEHFIAGVAEEEFEFQLDQVNAETVDRWIADSAQLKV